MEKNDYQSATKRRPIFSQLLGPAVWYVHPSVRQSLIVYNRPTVRFLVVLYRVTTTGVKWCIHFIFIIKSYRRRPTVKNTKLYIIGLLAAGSGHWWLGPTSGTPSYSWGQWTQDESRTDHAQDLLLRHRWRRTPAVTSASARCPDSSCAVECWRRNLVHWWHAPVHMCHSSPWYKQIYIAPHLFVYRYTFPQLYRPRSYANFSKHSQPNWPILIWTISRSKKIVKFFLFFLTYHAQFLSHIYRSDAKRLFQDQDFSCIIKCYNILNILYVTHWLRIFLKEYMIKCDRVCKACYSIDASRWWP